MDKAKEIQILQSLKGDTYFNQYFTDKDIDQMCQNITNDFAIECCCDFHTQTANLQAMLKQERQEKEKAIQKCSETAQAHMTEFASSIIIAAGEQMDAKVYDRIEEEFGIGFIIKTKRQAGIKLTEAEIDYLVSKI